MAKSKTEKPNSPVPISVGTAIAEPPSADEADISVPEAFKEPPSAPELPPPPAPPKTPTFFERMNRIHKDDWGPRANIYLYRTEPMIDRTRGGEKKYVQCYAEALSEERILVDHGSGRYKAVLNFKKPGAERGDEIDAYFFDLLNLNFPPKVPEGDWVDDPKNKRWAWARKAPTPPPVAPVPMSGMAEAATTLETLVNISERMAEKAKPPVQPAPAPAPVPPPAPDPFDTAKKIMDMRTNDPMIALLMARMDAQDKAAEAARQREYDLQKELRQKDSTPAQPAKSLFDQLVEFGGETVKTRIITGLFGGGTAAAETVTRGSRTTGMDLARDLGTQFFQSDLARGIGQWFGSLAERNVQTNPAINGNGNHAAPPPQIADPFQRFIQDVVNPKMLMFFNDEPNKEGGEAFADWLWAGFPEYFDRLQKFTHPMIPNMQGAAAILTGYRSTPTIWRQIGPQREAAFSEFVNSFCEWKPPTDEAEDVQDAEVVPETVDFDAEERVS